VRIRNIGDGLRGPLAPVGSEDLAPAPEGETVTTHLSHQSRLLAAAVALAVAIVAALALTQLRDSGGGGAAPAGSGGAITLHRSQSTSKVVVEGRTAKGESATAVGTPGRSVKGKAGRNGSTGSAKGGDGGSASAKAGSASAGSVVVQTTMP
jgi:hypothetical protein